MSTMSGGGASSQYDNLSALLEFVKSPDYVDRIKELRDLEDSSRKSYDEAKAAIAELASKSRQLAAEQASHDVAAHQLAANRAAHEKRVARWNEAMIGVQRALSNE